MRKLRSLHQVHSKRLHNDPHVPCSLQRPHSKGIGMITYIWNMPVNRSVPDTRTVTPLVKRWWNTLKTTFLNVKLERLCKHHHLQCITSSKDSEKLDISLCVRDKAEDLCWMPVVFGSSDDTASLISMILSLTLLNGPRNTSRNHCQ